MDHRRIPVLFPFLVLLIVSVVALAAPASVRAEELEVLKGTVKELQPGLLLLKNVSFQDETLPRRDIKVAWDNSTAFFHGVKKIPKEEVTPECRVLVKCTQVGSERKAILVRIIGGKTQ
jgi:hypothetical protein